MADSLPPVQLAQVQTATAPAPAPAGAVINGKIPNPTAEQREFAVKTTPNFAVEARTDGSYHLLIEASPAMQFPATAATVQQFIATTNSVARALQSAGFGGVKVMPEPIEMLYKPNKDDALLENNPANTKANAGTLRRPAAADSAFAAAGKGYKGGYFIDVTVNAPSAQAAPDKNVAFLEKQYTGLREALGQLPAVSATPAVVTPAVPAAPAVVAAAPVAVPAGPVFKVPNAAALSQEQREFFSKVGGYRVEAKPDGKVEVTFAPTPRIVGLDPTGSSRFSNLSDLGHKAFMQNGVTVLASPTQGVIKKVVPQQGGFAPSEAGNIQVDALPPIPDKNQDPTGIGGAFRGLGRLAGAVGLNSTHNAPLTFTIQGDAKQSPEKNAKDAAAMIEAFDKAVPNKAQEEKKSGGRAR